MTSAFVVPPAALHSQDHNTAPHQSFPDAGEQQHSTTLSAASQHLSPSVSRYNSDSLSPNLNNFETPGGSNSSLSHYQSSDFSDFDEDPFFGADFSNVEGGTPSFLEDHAAGLDPTAFSGTSFGAERAYNAHSGNTYPITPEQTASVQTTSPRSEQRGIISHSNPDRLPASISPQELQMPFKPSALSTQLTPSQSSSSCLSSEDGLAPATATAPAPATANMPCQSPRVTVSMWGKDSDLPVHTMERTFEDSPTTVRGGFEAAGDLISSSNDIAPTSAPRDTMGRWQRNPATGHAGLEPGRRPSDEVSSINEVMASHERKERNQEVGKWLADETNEGSAPEEESSERIKAFERPHSNHSDDDIPLGNQTENKYVPGQTYYSHNGGEMNQHDFDILASNRNFEDAPTVHPISRGVPGRHQPETSQAAIERFERMCRDNDSILSRAATWGTRRRSLHSIKDIDAEVVKSGNLLKKLSISKGDKTGKPGGLLKELRGLVRRPSASQLLKRTRSVHDEESLPGSDSRGSQDTKRDSVPHLAPPDRTGSWGKKQTPSINTALVSMGNNFASIGTTHARSGSISTASVTSPKSPFGGLTVRNTLRRPRSKSDLPRATPATSSMETHSNLVAMWKQTGGPPVASLAKTNSAEHEDEDEDEDDMYEDTDVKANANLIDEVDPTFAGFQQHIVTLNPGLKGPGHYLVDRIAHQQIIRYKQLLNCKVKHLKLGAGCPSGSLCLALGGSANILDSKGDSRELDPLMSHHPEEDSTPVEGAITHESFPVDIPMPPTQQLPAEFECQLCYQHKKFQKPSDWTKHVHEDVQPFTCTWDKCRDPKIFKRKADWVRHENEGHRHLEWWTCDVEDCRHTCYRRDNFLQHLVREHKFPEPKVKTKAAIKKSGGNEPAWQRVERCHVETSEKPQDEPCKFCGKAFPTWKKLTVHLAKHMEQISLPVLRLVAAKAKELDEDTIISPVQDPPPRPMMTLPIGHNGMNPYASSASRQQMTSNSQPVSYSAQEHFSFPNAPVTQFQQPSFYSPHYDNIGHQIQSTPMLPQQMPQGYVPNQQIQDIPVTTGPYMSAQDPYITMSSNGLEQFPQLSANALGLQSHGAAPLGGHMTYESMIGPSSGNGSSFSGQESASPYPRSPSQNGEAMWDNKQMTGFL